MAEEQVSGYGVPGKEASTGEWYIDYRSAAAAES